MVLAALVGAMNIAPFKYMWWFAGFIFLILIIVQLVQRFEGANDGYKLCNYIFIATACVYPLVSKCCLQLCLRLRPCLGVLCIVYCGGWSKYVCGVMAYARSA
jgi:hypothetical protein